MWHGRRRPARRPSSWTWTGGIPANQQQKRKGHRVVAVLTLLVGGVQGGGLGGAQLARPRRGRGSSRLREVEPFPSGIAGDRSGVSTGSGSQPSRDSAGLFYSNSVLHTPGGGGQASCPSRNRPRRPPSRHCPAASRPPPHRVLQRSPYSSTHPLFAPSREAVRGARG